MKTLNLKQAAVFLHANCETIRRMAAQGNIPAAKIGKGWVFLEEDLVLYLRSQYPTRDTSQGAITRSDHIWRFIREVKNGGSASAIMEKEYKEALGLITE